MIYDIHGIKMNNNQKIEELKRVLDKDVLRHILLKDVIRKITKYNKKVGYHHELILDDKDFVGKILDIGSQYCCFPIVAKLRDESRNVSAIEGSPFAVFIGANLAYKSDAKIRIYNKLIEEMEIDNNTFDCIVASNVIEHVYDFNRFMKWMVDKIKPNGVIYLTMPWKRHHWDPYHVHFFSDEDEEGCINIKKELEKRNYEIEEFKIISHKYKKTVKDVNKYKKTGVDWWIKYKVKK